MKFIWRTTMLARFAAFILVAAASLASVALAQDDYEIQVYAAETVVPRSTMVELHSNFYD
jgi:hypothetical protein